MSGNRPGTNSSNEQYNSSYFDWLRSRNNTQTQSRPWTQNFADFGKGASALTDMYFGWENLNLAKDQNEYTKNIANANLNNSAISAGNVVYQNAYNEARRQGASREEAQAAGQNSVSNMGIERNLDRDKLDGGRYDFTWD